MDSHVEAKPRRSSRRRRWLAAGVVVPVLAVAVAACGSSSSSSQTSPSSSTVASVGGSPGFVGQARSGGGSNARSTGATGGSVGTIASVSSSGFTFTTPTGGKVSVRTTSSTAYDEGTSTSQRGAVANGKTVLVIGKVDSTTITATEVIVDPSINLQKASARVVTFKQGAQGSSKSVGQIPSAYKQGTGTLVSGTKATEAIEASLESYAGGVVDRVVQLGNGDYEVHNIGTNWPHHVFVNTDFKVIGAND